MKILWILIVVITTTFSNYGQVTATQEQLKKADEIVALFKSPYVKFDDGAVYPIRRFALRHQGVKLPPLSAHPNTNRLFYYKIVRQYKIMDNTSTGCRIEPVNVYGEYYDTNTDTDMFVEGLRGYSGRMYGAIFLRQEKGDSFTYTTALGGARTIPKYECGVSATKQEFDDYIKHQLTN